MNDNFYNENIGNFNDYNTYEKVPYYDLDLNKYPGIFSNASDNNSKINNNINQDNYKNMFFSEEAIPYSPEMSEEPEHPNKTKKIITDNITNHKNHQSDEKIFTFNKENNSLNNYLYNSNTQDNLEQNKQFQQLNENLNNNQEYNNIIKANILNFEDIIRKKNNESIIKNKANNINNNNNNFNEQINYNQKLNHNKKNSKNLQNKGNNEMNKNIYIKKKNKSQKKPSNKKKIFEQIDMNVIEFESYINNKNKNKKNQKPIITQNIVNNKSKDKSLNNNYDYKINNYFNIKTPKQPSENITKIQKTKINQNPQRKSNKLRNGNLIKKSKDNSTDAIINIKNRKSSKLKNNYKNNKTFAIEKENSIISSKSQMVKKKRPNTLRGLRKNDDNLAPKEVTEAEINLAIENENIGKNIQKRFSPINNNLINFDNSKFAKYDTEQIKYGLIKGYANIHPEKDNSFLQRMQFEAIKRKNKDMKINELLEKSKNKYKIKESQREKAFDRLVNDANRRLILKQEMIENERYLDDFKDLLDTKKYNDNEWNEIYKKRFKDYEECKKKKIDIKRQNEKIKKMIKEEEEINMCHMKKLPKQKIKENTQRLYDDAKKREMIRNKNLKEANSVKNYKLTKKDNILLTSFKDEEDASKYMKGHKSGTYKFMGENANNVSYNNYNIYNNKKRQKYFNDNKTFTNNNTQNINRSFDRALNRKSNKMTVTEFNNKRFDTNSNIQNNEKKKNKIIKKNKKNNDYNNRDNKSQFNDFTFNNNIDISRYFSIKNNNYQNSLSQMQNNNFSSQIPYGYNYNNYNIYNINNLNNNINNINTNDDNDIDNYNLTNLAEQLIHTAAINKIESNKNKNKKRLNMNNLYSQDNEIKNNNKYININENNYDNDNYNNNYNFYYDNKYNIGEEKNKKFDFNSYNDAQKLVDQFLISKYEY